MSPLHALGSVCAKWFLLGTSFMSLLLLFIITNLLKQLPYTRNFLSWLFVAISGVAMPYDMFYSSLCGFKMMKSLWRMCYLNIMANLKEGKSFPDALLVDTKDLQRSVVAKDILRTKSLRATLKSHIQLLNELMSKKNPQLN